jgi:hypothetical protein
MCVTTIYYFHKFSILYVSLSFSYVKSNAECYNESEQKELHLLEARRSFKEQRTDTSTD